MNENCNENCTELRVVKEDIKELKTKVEINEKSLNKYITKTELQEQTINKFEKNFCELKQVGYKIIGTIIFSIWMQLAFLIFKHKF